MSVVVLEYQDITRVTHFQLCYRGSQTELPDKLLSLLVYVTKYIALTSYL